MLFKGWKMSSWTLWRHLPVRYQLTTATEENEAFVPKHVPGPLGHDVKQTLTDGQVTRCQVLVRLYKSNPSQTVCSRAAFPRRQSPFIQTFKRQQRLSSVRQWFPDSSVPACNPLSNNTRKDDPRLSTLTKNTCDHCFSTFKYVIWAASGSKTASSSRAAPSSMAASCSRAASGSRAASDRRTESISRITPETELNSTFKKYPKVQRSKGSNSLQTLTFDQTYTINLNGGDPPIQSHFGQNKLAHLKTDNTSANKRNMMSLYVHGDKSISHVPDGGHVVRRARDALRCEKCTKSGAPSSNQSLGSPLRTDNEADSLLNERIDYMRRTDRLLSYYTQVDSADTETLWDGKLRMSRSKHTTTPDSGRTSRSNGILDHGHFIRSSVSGSSPFRSRSAVLQTTQKSQERQSSRAEFQEDWNVVLGDNYQSTRRGKSFLCRL
ncbi:unnamed protein product [Lymnaea stagnalis]|uniref:Uncharacterized protein n=1 Tax=Lymnaea stagnalis TaxID=6523 RepID=A0AAV2INA2_LYMST